MQNNSRPFNHNAARPHAEAERLNARMYVAIMQNDQYTLEAALQNGANPDADDGKALRLCASGDKYLLAKTLLLAGGDIGYALMQARRENDAIPRRTDSGMILTFSTPISEEGKKRERELAREISKLESFQKCFLDSSLPMEQMNLLREIRAAQHDLARRMDALEKNLREIDSPKPIDKKPTHPQPAGPRLKRSGT
ncbi:MAG: hypothetical protein ACK4PK_06535 [Alphaproteobacteria bacterium]